MGAKSAVLGFPQVEHLFKTDGRWEMGDGRFWILRMKSRGGFLRMCFTKQDFGFWIKNNPIPYSLFPTPLF
jgi:hypothetical protein